MRELQRVKTGVYVGSSPGIVNRPPKNFGTQRAEKIARNGLRHMITSARVSFEHGILEMVRPEPGSKFIGTTTRTEHKVANGVFRKRKVQLCDGESTERGHSLPTRWVV